MAAIQQIMLARPPSAPARTYATWNPADKHSTVALSNGDLSATMATSYGGVRATIYPTSGKWYWEVRVDTTPPTLHIGFAYSAFAVTTGYAPGRDTAGQSGGYSAADGGIYASDALVASGGAYGVGDVIGIALDISGSSVAFFKNNALQWNGGIPVASCTACVGAKSATGGGSITANFGATPFTYSPPTGYNAGLYL